MFSKFAILGAPPTVGAILGAPPTVGTMFFFRPGFWKNGCDYGNFHPISWDVTPAITLW